MVKVRHLLAKDEVLEQRRATLAGDEELLVGNGSTNVGCHVAFGVIDLELGEVAPRRATVGPGGEICDVGVGALGPTQADEAN